MSILMGSAVVILAYVGLLAIVVTRRVEPRPLWRDVRFWASIVVLVQIAVYAWLG